LVSVLVIAFAGCGDSSDVASSAEKGPGETAASTTATRQDPPHPVPRVPPQQKPLKKLVVKDLVVGKGPVARWGDEASVRYVGVYYKTGKSYSQHWGFSWEFPLDGKSPGPGWQKGIHGMRVGGRRELLIPSDLLFGDGDLAYIVELLRVKAGPRSYAEKAPFSAIAVRGGGKEPRFDPPDRPPPKKLLFRELEKGYGPAVKRGDEVAIRYAGAMYASGEVRYGGKAGPFSLGSGGLGAAFERGIEGMRGWGRRELIVPSRFLGNSGAVDYVIELTRLEPTSAKEAGG